MRTGAPPSIESSFRPRTLGGGDEQRPDGDGEMRACRQDAAQQPRADHDARRGDRRCPDEDEDELERAEPGDPPGPRAAARGRSTATIASASAVVASAGFAAQHGRRAHGRRRSGAPCRRRRGRRPPRRSAAAGAPREPGDGGGGEDAHRGVERAAPRARGTACTASGSSASRPTAASSGPARRASPSAASRQRHREPGEREGAVDERRRLRDVAEREHRRGERDRETRAAVSGASAGPGGERERARAASGGQNGSSEPPTSVATAASPADGRRRASGTAGAVRRTRGAGRERRAVVRRAVERRGSRRCEGRATYASRSSAASRAAVGRFERGRRRARRRRRRAAGAAGRGRRAESGGAPGGDRGRDLRERDAPERVAARRAPPRGSRRRPRRRSARVASSPESRSGEMYASVPGTSPTAVSVSASSNCASPKSSTRIDSSSLSSTSTFDGFTSRCTIPRRCACASPSSTWAAISTAVAVARARRCAAPRAACCPARTRTRCRRDPRRRRSRRRGRSARGAAARRPPSRARARGALALAGDDLERDLEARPLVAGQPDRAGAAAAERLQGPVAVEDERCGRGGRRRCSTRSWPLRRGRRTSSAAGSPVHSAGSGSFGGELPAGRRRPRRDRLVTSHDDDILDFDFVDDETRELAPPASRPTPRRRAAVRRAAGRPRPAPAPASAAPHGLTPLLRLAALVAFAILVVVLLAVWVQGCAGDDEQTTYGDYMAEIGDVGKDSAKIGADLATLLTTPGLAQAELETQLGGLVQQQELDVQRARDIDAAGPADAGARPRDRRRSQLRVAGIAGHARHVPRDEGLARTRPPRASSSRRMGQRLEASDVVWQDLFQGTADESMSDGGRRGPHRAGRPSSSTNSDLYTAALDELDLAARPRRVDRRHAERAPRQPARLHGGAAGRRPAHDLDRDEDHDLDRPRVRGRRQQLRARTRRSASRSS